MYIPRDPTTLPELPKMQKDRSEDTFYFCPETEKIMYWSTTAPAFVFSPTSAPSSQRGGVASRLTYLQ